MSEEARGSPVSACVVGIGASAGGLEALERFFADIPSDTGLSFVVATHLAPEHESLLPELLSRVAKVPVLCASDNTSLDPGHVYVMPAGAEMTVADGKLWLHPVADSPCLRTPIDRLLLSLAQEFGDGAAGVILSGTGSDGARGIEAIEAAGGLVAVQSPGSAAYPGMPEAAIATGAADIVAPIEELPGRVVEVFCRPDSSLKEEEDVRNGIARELGGILAAVSRETTHDFSSYKPSTLIRRIHRRMAIHGLRDAAEYARRLRDDPAEARALFNDLLISVTSFFRDPEAYDLLARTAIRDLLSRNQEEPVRVWVVGCATGEEAYSVAMAFREQLTEHPGSKLQIFGTDADPRAIACARVGRYREAVAETLSRERLCRYFDKVDGAYQISGGLREMIVFATHNLIQSPPFSRLDLILCRNVLIYLNPEIQKKILPLFHRCLNPGGYLLLGTSETVGTSDDLFAPVDAKWRLYRRREVPSRIDPTFPVQVPSRVLPLPERPVCAAPEPVDLVSAAEKLLLSDFAPTSLVVNEKRQVVHLSKSPHPYLELPPGEPTTDLLRMTREELRPPLRAALHKAFKEGEPCTYKGLKVSGLDGDEYVDLTVWPITEPPGARGNALVVFRPASAVS
ncbi:MAG: chemotaxis protein CheB, partial [Deltaproteobacteria bacterium]|nr:chemotaxis protein CheB [Deltaproteobacteria bacterium]